MKSLSILILLGTVTALVIGGLFAVSPVLANTPTSPDAQSDVLAPTTGLAAEQVGQPQAQLVEDLSTTDASTITQPGGPSASQNDFAPNPDEGLNAFTVALQKEEAPAQADAEEVSSGQAKQAAAAADILSALNDFVASVSTGTASQVTGIYVDNVLALNVGQQPSGNPGYISGNMGEATQFSLASDYGSLGFLAHNYLSGADFFNLSIGQTITLVYGDGSTENYRIDQIRSFEALQPNSPQSEFVDLDFGDKLSAAELFYSMYDNDNTVVLQTCIANNGISTWGRVFIIAVPVVS